MAETVTDDKVPLRCAACDAVILMVKPSTAKAFSSGRWLCADLTCHAERQARANAEAGKLL